jgi:hypothetical protein
VSIVHDIMRQVRAGAARLHRVPCAGFGACWAGEGGGVLLHKDALLTCQCHNGIPYWKTKDWLWVAGVGMQCSTAELDLSQVLSNVDSSSGCAAWCCAADSGILPSPPGALGSCHGSVDCCLDVGGQGLGAQRSTAQTGAGRWVSPALHLGLVLWDGCMESHSTAGHAGHTVSTCTAPDFLDLALWVGKALVRKGLSRKADEGGSY